MISEYLNYIVIGEELYPYWVWKVFAIYTNKYVFCFATHNQIKIYSINKIFNFYSWINIFVLINKNKYFI